MQVTKLETQVWLVQAGKRPVAKIFLNSKLAIEEIVLYTGLKPERRKIKELAAAYSLATEFNFSQKGSETLLNLGAIPVQIIKSPDSELNSCVERFKILLVDANFRSPDRVLRKVVVRIRKAHRIKLDAWIYNLDDPSWIQ